MNITKEWGKNVYLTYIKQVSVPYIKHYIFVVISTQKSEI